MEIFLIAVVIGLLPAAIASGKGHNFVLWWLFGAALFIVALPCALILKDPKKQAAEAARDAALAALVANTSAATRQAPASSETATVDADPVKKCPWCAETIKAEAKICRFCDREVETLAHAD